MNMTETDDLLRTRRALTGQTFNDETVRAWQAVLARADYGHCHEAMTYVARDEKRITVAHICERLPIEVIDEPPPPPPVCIRCEVEPAEHLHTRCAYCQTIVDDQAANGVTDALAMIAAVDAAHRRGTPCLEP